MGLALDISRAFASGALNLSARHDAPHAGWESLPECVFGQELRARDEDDRLVRYALTLVAAMDRARDADKLWRRGLDLHRRARWAYETAEVVARPLSVLGDTLKSTGVSQRHLQDSAAWRRIAETLHASSQNRPVRAVIDSGTGSAPTLLEDLASTTAGGSSSFPFLGGPKVGPMWVRMMAFPGNASISNLHTIPVAVDTQVRRVSELLGVTETAGMDLEKARPLIQSGWTERARRDGVDAPGALAGTTAGLDPALWFFAKWGCSYCERQKRRVPIHPACAACQLHEEA